MECISVREDEVIKLFFEGYTIKSLIKMVKSMDRISTREAQHKVEKMIFDYYAKVQ